MNCYVFIILEWVIYIYIHRGSPHMEVTIMFLQFLPLVAIRKLNR